MTNLCHYKIIAFLKVPLKRCSAFRKKTCLENLFSLIYFSITCYYTYYLFTLLCLQRSCLGSVLFCSTCVSAKDGGRGLAAVVWSDWAVLVIDSWNETQRGKINSIGMNFPFGAETALVFENVDDCLVTTCFIVLLVFWVLIFQKCWILSLISVCDLQRTTTRFSWRNLLQYQSYW